MFISCQMQECPEDFIFEYKTYQVHINSIDSVYLKKFDDKDSTLNSNLTKEEKRKIYNKMGEINIFEYPEIVNFPSKIFIQEPNRFLKITSNARTYEIKWSYPSTDKRANKLDNLAELIENCIN